ncbi:hypothetical protein B0T24DRAFT_550162 [Lasiosphaeria ovina]|uniref:Uncharacterized protein n=1 Tax=Lasiosphaeria ovina TaxID=92902 RepID=A0AAE0NA63_9PEZI|nr:hypothetical protein B0T24DRAFT_550162 [Lasiosphaeria ovina]
MGSNDVPPEGCPWWLVPVHMGLLGVGLLLWDATYILMIRRAMATKSYSMPLLGLAINLSWELVYLFYVVEMPIEAAGFLFWLLLDVGLVYTTVRFAPEDWKNTSPWVGRNIAWILALMTAVACFGNYSFAAWWLAEPGMGSGDKAGKWWCGQEGHDTTELAFWSAGFAQVVASAGSIAMLIVRGHSGGTGYAIWFCRAMGTLFGLVLCNVLMWWYWPEAHGFIVSPFAVFLWATAIACDVAYPLVLWQVRRLEQVLPDGRVIAGGSLASSPKAFGVKKGQ